ncbi:helix-turn-helix domain-containing protein [Pseudomonas sp. 43A]|uniref:helix-turn-helix domain-containing protein n=1 Tax=unclassified Pseudomonas TaxID=196821 RepID=UPI001587D706|nr:MULTISPECIES: helix-turn-helix domain-containing protein [unclassified Pseudomonas]QKV65299.1 helix-turn-helix domain-containing protein [Pseudomonas sp. 43A]QMW12247.1 helix-turn-helix domain-containing protein [Pseudomonas sp. 29A]
MNIRTKKPTACPHENYRAKIAETRTVCLADHIYDKRTGELVGTYITKEFSPELFVADAHKLTAASVFWYMEEDGTPVFYKYSETPSPRIAEVVELFPEQSPPQAIHPTSKSGRKPQAIQNHLSTALTVLILEDRASWLEDFTLGAICTGPGVINGKHSVSRSDVKKLLRLPVISVANAADCLLNHNRAPMSTRQLQRVVEAARIALRGVALHLERHPEILQSIEMTVDFDKFWITDAAQSGHQEHPKKSLVLEMIRAGTAIKATARELGISKNTVKKWDAEARSSAGTTMGGVSDR